MKTGKGENAKMGKRENDKWRKRTQKIKQKLKQNDTLYYSE